MPTRKSKLETNPAHRTSSEDYAAVPVRRPEHSESRLTLLLEEQSAKIPSHLFLTLSLCAMGASLAFELAGRRRTSQFVGMWPPALLVMGVYNKLVKTNGVI